MKQVIGIDFGKTITYKLVDGERTTYPHALRVIHRLVQAPHTKVVIISKVDDEQMKRALKWIEVNDFYNNTGLVRSDIFFCKERYEKSNIAREIGVTHHIDDRPEVMAHMDPGVHKYLFNPIATDVVTFFNQLVNTRIVESWLEIERIFFED